MQWIFGFKTPKIGSTKFNKEWAKTRHFTTYPRHWIILFENFNAKINCFYFYFTFLNWKSNMLFIIILPMLTSFWYSIYWFAWLSRYWRFPYYTYISIMNILLLQIIKRKIDIVYIYSTDFQGKLSTFIINLRVGF